MRHSQVVRPFAAPLVILALTGLALWPVTAAQFVSFDDGYYLVGNSRVREGLTPAAVGWALTTREASNWHPLTWISHMAALEIFGLDPFGHHLVNLLLHLLSALLCHLWLAGMTGAPRRSLLAALLFAVHPLHVESVAWVAERKDVLSGFFWNATLLAHLAFVRRPGGRRALPVAILFLISLAAKPMVVTLPLVLLILDWWPLGRLVRRPGAGGSPLAAAVAEKLPLLVPAAAASLVAIWAQGESGALKSLREIPPGMRFGNALVSAAAYLERAILPRDLAVFYPFPEGGHSATSLARAAAILLILTLAALLLRRASPALGAGWVWYLVTLLPVIGIIQVGDQARADRYTYLPLTGVFVAAAWCLGDLGRRRPSLRPLLAVAGAAVVAVLIPISRAQAGHWRDDVALFGRAVAVTRGNLFAADNLTRHLLDAGRLEDAAVVFQRLLGEVSPARQGWVRNNLGAVREKQGRLAEAAEHFQAAALLEPGSPLPPANAGGILLRLGRWAEAEESYRRAVALRRGDPLLHRGLGLALARQGRLAAAAAEMARAAALEGRPPAGGGGS
jgi:tetratricopeptide (TPR) repeat protein